jgi:hypothetical protein
VTRVELALIVIAILSVWLGDRAGAKFGVLCSALAIGHMMLAH